MIHLATDRRVLGHTVAPHSVERHPQTQASPDRERPERRLTVEGSRIEQAAARRRYPPIRQLDERKRAEPGRPGEAENHIQRCEWSSGFAQNRVLQNGAAANGTGSGSAPPPAARCARTGSGDGYGPRSMHPRPARCGRRRTPRPPKSGPTPAIRTPGAAARAVPPGGEAPLVLVGPGARPVLRGVHPRRGSPGARAREAVSSVSRPDQESPNRLIRGH